MIFIDLKRKPQFFFKYQVNIQGPKTGYLLTSTAMIDWVSIVRSSGQRFSNVIVNSVPNKVRRKRRKRRLQEQHEQVLQQQRQFGGPINAINSAGSSSSGGIIISSPTTSFSVNINASPQCICEIYPVPIGENENINENENEGASLNSNSFRPGSLLSSSSFGSGGGSGTNNYLSSSPQSTSGFPIRHNSLCEVHGKLVSDTEIFSWMSQGESIISLFCVIIRFNRLFAESVKKTNT